MPVRWAMVVIGGALLVSGCSDGDPETAAPSSVVTTVGSTTTRPATSTTAGITTTTLDMRSVPVPAGAPPLPLYSGDPVVMTRALFDFLCWVDQHPVEAGVVADLYTISGSELNTSQAAEQRRTAEGQLVLSDCRTVLDVTAAEVQTHDPPRVGALMTSSRPFSEEVGPDGASFPRPTWQHRETLIEWELISDGTWKFISSNVRTGT